MKNIFSNGEVFEIMGRADGLELSRDEWKHRAAQLEAERDEARAALVRYQDERVQLLGRIETIQMMYRSDHDERIRQEEKIKQLERELKYFHSTDLAADAAMAHYYDDETPIGIALDGQGDEVEP